VPKCAGSSLRYAFYEASKKNDYFSRTNNYISMFTHGNICLHLDQPCIKAIHEDTRLFIDHSISYFIEDAFNLEIEEVYRILTVRHPISRFISHCLFFEKKHPKELNFKELDSLICEFGNLTIKMLTEQRYDREKTIETQHKIAKQEIEKYDFIFVQEKLADSIKEFNSTNPFNLNLENVEHNVNSKKEDFLIEDNLREYLEEKLSLEIDLLKNYYF
jgi:hypothetical protein